MIGAQRRGSVPMTEAETVFRQVLNDALASRLDFYVEHIDVDRFAEEQYQSTVAEFLRRKYDGLRIDLVIATTTSVIQLLEHSRPELFHDLTFVFMAEVPFQPTPKATGIYSGLDLRGTLDLALRLQPRTRRVFVIAGASESDHVYEKLARQQFQELEGRLAFTYFSGLPMNELQKSVANLPPDSVIYALSNLQDGAGSRFGATDFMDLLSPSPMHRCTPGWSLPWGTGSWAATC